MSDPKQVLLSRLVDGVISRLDDMCSDKAVMPPDCVVRLQQVEFDIKYSMPEGVSIPPRLFLRPSPWSTRDLRRLLVKHDRKILISARQVAGQPSQNIHQLHLTVNLRER